MKILCAIDGLHGGGAETSLVDMVPALRERNVHLSLVTLLADDDALTARIQELEVPIRRLAGYSWPGRFAELRRELHRLRPDVLHTSLARSDLVGRAAAVGVDVPVVTTLVNSSYGPEHRANSVYGPLVVKAAQVVDMVAARRTTYWKPASSSSWRSWMGSARALGPSGRGSRAAQRTADPGSHNPVRRPATHTYPT
jgi:hypothetical protein